MTKELGPYEDNMDDWNESYGILRAMWISQFVPKVGKLLDVAGYHGDLKKYISKDINYNLIDLFAPLSVNGISWDLDKTPLPYSDREFDTIVALDIFEHIKKPFELLNEIRRILKDDGLLITSRHLVPTKRHYFDITEAFFEDWKIMKRIPMAEATYREGEKLNTTLMLTPYPTEVFYLMRKT